MTYSSEEKEALSQKKTSENEGEEKPLKRKITNNKIPPLLTNTLKSMPMEVENVDALEEGTQGELSLVKTNAEGNLKRNSFKRQPSRFRKSSTKVQGDSFIRRLSKKLSQSFGNSNKISSNLITEQAPQKRNNIFRRISQAARQASSVFFNRSRKSEFRINYLVLYRDYKQEKPRYAYYLILDLLRHFFLSAVLVFMYEYPFEQTIIITFTNFMILSYLIVVRPFANLKDFILNLINETMILLGCGACLVMANMDRKGDEDHEKRFKAGWVIFYVNMSLMLVFTAMFFLELLFSTKEILPKLCSLLKSRFEAYKKKKKGEYDSTFAKRKFSEFAKDF